MRREEEKKLEGPLDAAVVGGGLGGLATAAILAERGRRVAVLEKAPSIGGRAATDERSGFLFNRGPHALYRGGAARAVLKGLGIDPEGGAPPTSGGLAIEQGRSRLLPGGLGSLLATRLLGPGAKLELARLLLRLPRIDTAPFAAESVRSWLEREVRHASVRRLLEALVRLGTYARELDRLSAGAALAQLQRALDGGVLYLHGGWRTIVEALARRAEAGGAEVRPGTAVSAIEECSGGWRVRLAGGRALNPPRGRARGSARRRGAARGERRRSHASRTGR